MSSQLNEIKVLVVDAQAVARQGLTQIINQEDDLIVCGEADSVDQAIEATATLKPDLVITDLQLNGTSGLELIKKVRSQNDNLPILVITLYNEKFYAERAIRVGAKGYLMKHEKPETIIEAIHQIMSGEIFLSTEIRSRMLHKFAYGRIDDSLEKFARLSDRELEVFELIGRGHDRKQIAEILHLRIKTIETHWANIKRKLQLNSREVLRQAIHWILQQTVQSS